MQELILYFVTALYAFRQNPVALKSFGCIELSSSIFVINTKYNGYTSTFYTENGIESVQILFVATVCSLKHYIVRGGISTTERVNISRGGIIDIRKGTIRDPVIYLTTFSKSQLSVGYN